jgi:hypothetical protein
MALKGVLKTTSTIQAKTVAVAPPTSLLDLTDIDSALLSDGSLMVYDEASKKFVLKPEVQNPNTKIIGGSF